MFVVTKNTHFFKKTTKFCVRNYSNVRLHFDRNIHRMHRQVAAGKDGHEYLFEEIGSRMSERLDDIQNKTFGTVLEIGCRKGSFSKKLMKKEGVSTMVLMDSSEKMVSAAVKNLKDINESTKIQGIVGDEEFLPFAPESFDLVVSNLNLHWVNDLQGVFEQVNEILKPDGIFMASMFGDQSLLELQFAESPQTQFHSTFNFFIWKEFFHVGRARERGRSKQSLFSVCWCCGCRKSSGEDKIQANNR